MPLRRILAMIGAASLLVVACGSGDDTALSIGSVPVPPEVVSSVPTGSTTTTVAESSSASGSPVEPQLIEPPLLLGLYEAEVISTKPHDPTAYTQGLEIHDDLLLESTGRYGESDRRWVDPTSGTIVRSVDLDPDLFGEGATVVDDQVVQLTWLAGTAIYAGSEDLEEIRTTDYEGQGWGLCFDGSSLIMSNGSSELTIRDPETFESRGVVSVVDGAGEPVTALNELECLGDQVLANIYGIDQIVAIDTDTGQLDAVIDLHELRPVAAPADDLDFALNGIAFDPSTGNFLITGKLWDTLYEVQFVPA